MKGKKRGVTDRRRQSVCKKKKETPQTNAAQVYERKKKKSYRLQPSPPKSVKEKRGNRPPPPKLDQTGSGKTGSALGIAKTADRCRPRCTPPLSLGFPRLEECCARTICRLLGQRGPSPSSQSRDCAPTPSGTVVWRNASNRVHPRLTDGVDASRLPPLSSGNVLWENGSNRGSSSAERRALGVPNDAAARGRRPAPKK